MTLCKEKVYLWKEKVCLTSWSNRCCRTHEAHLKLEWTIKSDAWHLHNIPCLRDTDPRQNARREMDMAVIRLKYLEAKMIALVAHWTVTACCIIDASVDRERKSVWNLYTWQVDLHVVCPTSLIEDKYCLKNHLQYCPSAPMRMHYSESCFAINSILSLHTQVNINLTLSAIIGVGFKTTATSCKDIS